VVAYRRHAHERGSGKLTQWRAPGQREEKNISWLGEVFSESGREWVCGREEEQHVLLVERAIGETRGEPTLFSSLSARSRTHLDPLLLLSRVWSVWLVAYLLPYPILSYPIHYHSHHHAAGRDHASTGRDEYLVVVVVVGEAIVPDAGRYQEADPVRVLSGQRSGLALLCRS